MLLLAPLDGEPAAFTFVRHHWCPTWCSPRIVIIVSAFAIDNENLEEISTPRFAALQWAAGRICVRQRRAGFV